MSINLTDSEIGILLSVVRHRLKHEEKRRGKPERIKKREAGLMAGAPDVSLLAIERLRSIESKLHEARARILLSG